jgi:hypothetical protein
MFAMGIEQFVLYEVHFTQAHVNIEFGKFGSVTI